MRLTQAQRRSFLIEVGAPLARARSSMVPQEVLEARALEHREMLCLSAAMALGNRAQYQVDQHTRTAQHYTKRGDQGLADWFQHLADQHAKDVPVWVGLFRQIRAEGVPDFVGELEPVSLFFSDNEKSS